MKGNAALTHRGSKNLYVPTTAGEYGEVEDLVRFLKSAIHVSGNFTGTLAIEVSSNQNHWYELGSVSGTGADLYQKIPLNVEDGIYLRLRCDADISGDIYVAIVGEVAL